MSTWDELEVDLPNFKGHFVTKTFGCCFDEYLISPDGNLIKHLPERQQFGRSGEAAIVTRPAQDVYQIGPIELRFYDSTGEDMSEYVAQFDDFGRLFRLQRITDVEAGPKQITGPGKRSRRA